MLPYSLFLAGLSYEIGVLCPIDQLSELTDSPDILSKFTADGIRQYSKINLEAELFPLLENCIRQTLSKTQIDTSMIDAVIIASSTVLDGFSGTYLNRFFKKFGFYRAQLHGVTLAECANLVSALKFAERKIETERLENILIVVLDVIHGGRSRIVHPKISVYSDAISSFVISTKLTSNIQIKHMDIHFDNTVWTLDHTTDTIQYMDAYAKGTERYIRRFFKQTELRPEHIDILITSNFSLSLAELFSELICIPMEKMLLKNIGRMGHAYACDNLINLKDYCDDSALDNKSSILLFSTGVGVWGGVLLSKASTHV